MRMREGKWQKRDISQTQVLEVIREFGAPTTGEIKWSLHTDSSSIRVPLGNLLAANKVFPMAYKGGITWIEVTGKRGRPNPGNIRREHGHLSPRKDNARKAAKESAVTLSTTTRRSTPESETRRKWMKLAAMVEDEQITERQFQAACKKLGISAKTGRPL